MEGLIFGILPYITSTVSFILCLTKSLSFKSNAIDEVTCMIYSLQLSYIS